MTKEPDMALVNKFYNVIETPFITVLTFPKVHEFSQKSLPLPPVTEVRSQFKS